jgi:hypothetical protein
LDVFAGIRAEWAKTRARAARWREEVVLLDEEMHRALDYCWWRSQWWNSRVEIKKALAPHIAEGLSAYAREQQDAEQARALSWAAQWSAVRARAVSVLNGHLSSLPQLTVEITDDEEDGGEDEEDEC